MIKRVVYDDLEDILKLQKTAFLSEAELYDNYNIEPLTQTIESIRSDFENHVFLKAEYKGDIIGSVKVRNNDSFCWIGKLMVNPDFRNKGIGRMLMTEAEKIYPQAVEYILFTGSESMKNIQLYESLGYVKTEEFEDEKSPKVLLVKMIKKNPVIEESQYH